MTEAHTARSAMRLLKRGLDLAVDIMAPPQCLVCRSRVQANACLCPVCWSRLAIIEAPRCDRLGLPFPYDQGESAISAAASADPPAWDRARSAVAFNDVSRALVHALKYRDRHEAALFMSRLMHRAVLDLLEGAHLVVPVPLHRRRLWLRRYNQAAMLARRLGQATGLAYRPELLVRGRATRQQVGLDFSERRKNMRGAFTVPEDSRGNVRGRNIVLVDDVLTTGATAASACATLKAAGAGRVDILTFALVIEPGRGHISTE